MFSLTIHTHTESLVNLLIRDQGMFLMNMHHLIGLCVIILKKMNYNKLQFLILKVK